MERAWKYRFDESQLALRRRKGVNKCAPRGPIQGLYCHVCWAWVAVLGWPPLSTPATPDYPTSLNAWHGAEIIVCSGSWTIMRRPPLAAVWRLDVLEYTRSYHKPRLTVSLSGKPSISLNSTSKSSRSRCCCSGQTTTPTSWCASWSWSCCRDVCPCTGSGSLHR